MTAFSDETIGMVVTALKKRDMWKHTLLVFSSDNGGWLDYAGDNTPLRGGKFSDLEGGTRVLSLVSGGLIPPSVRGQPVTGYAAICDWYSTFLGLAGIQNITDSRAASAGLPAVDSLNVWPMLSGSNDTSPRVEIPLSAKPANDPDWKGWLVHENDGIDTPYPVPTAGYYLKGEALIVGDWKLVVGPQQSGPFSTNGTHLFTDCGEGCLYNIMEDPSEMLNLNTTHPKMLKQLQARQEQIRQTVFAPDRGAMDPNACAVIRKNGGYYAPWL